VLRRRVARDSLAIGSFWRKGSANRFWDRKSVSITMNINTRNVNGNGWAARAADLAIISHHSRAANGALSIADV